MSLYKEYLNEIEMRKQQGLKPKPIDNGLLLKEIIANIKEEFSPHREESLHFLVYNTLPGTTSAAVSKSDFLGLCLSHLLRRLSFEKLGKKI